MLARIVASALWLAGGRFVASPYLPTRDFDERFAEGVMFDDVDEDFRAPDDTPPTVARIAALRDAVAAASVARFADAARSLSAFAAAQPEAREAGWALRRAYQYWRALGREDEALAARDAYEARHARREPAAAALFFWERFAELRDDEARAEHARRYLEAHARRGPRDVAVVAEAELAAALWRGACPDGWHGLCVTRRTVRLAHDCTRGRAELLELQPRHVESRRAALRHAAAALRVGARLDVSRDAPWRRAALRAALGQAAGIVADDAVEGLIAVAVPTGLRFDVEEWKADADVARWRDEHRTQVRRRDDSSRRLDRYQAQSQARLTRVTRALRAVADTRSVPAIVAGSLRLAIVYAHLRDAWARMAEPPESFARGDAVVYTQCLDDVTAPLLRAASELLGSCARMARRSGQFSPELALCFEGFGAYTHGEATGPLSEIVGGPG